MPKPKEQSVQTVTGEPNDETEKAKKLPKPAPLSNPQVFAALDNDANADGKPKENGIYQDLTMLTNVNTIPGNVKPGQKIKNPIVSPQFNKPKEPVYQMAPKVPGGQAAPTGGKSSKSGSGSKSGSTTESETSVGSMGETGTKIGGINEILSAEAPDVKTINPGPDLAFLDAPATTKSAKDETVKNFKSDSLGDFEFSFNHKDVHNDLPESEIAGSRPYQTVSDLISDTGKSAECPDGRNCIHKDEQDGTKDTTDAAATVDATKQKSPGNDTTVKAKNMITDCKLRGDCKTEATSKDVEKAKGGNLAQTVKEEGLANGDQFKQLDEAEIQKLSAKERLHKFFGSITVDKNVYNVVGTAEMANVKTKSKPELSKTEKLVVDTDVRKHNIGFNVLLPSRVIKHFAAPRFKEHSKLLGPKGKKTQVASGENSMKVHGGIKKITDAISSANKRKYVASLQEPHVVINKASIATVAKGESGDIGATKPLQGLLLEAKAAKKAQGDLGASAPGNTALGTDASHEASASKTASSAGNKPIQNNLGSIVTLVGKVKADRLNGKKHAKAQSDKASKDSNSTIAEGHKKEGVKQRPDVKHLKHNSSETNAANIAETGPSNSIIVSSVIVVIIASFVVVGMAVVAIVSVVARYCRLGRRLDAS